jgi:Phage integrase family
VTELVDGQRHRLREVAVGSADPRVDDRGRPGAVPGTQTTQLGEQVGMRLRNGSFGPPKSRYGRSDVPISTPMGQRLWTARAERKAGDDEPAFCAGNGGYLDAANVFGRVLKPAARRAGVEWAGFHTLRYTCATVLFRRGLNAKQVQIWLGHHSPAFTLAVYVHLLSDDLPDADLFAAVEEPDAEAEVEAVGALALEA